MLAAYMAPLKFLYRTEIGYWNWKLVYGAQGLYMEPIVVQGRRTPGVLIKEPYKRVLYRTFRGAVYKAIKLQFLVLPRNFF